MVPNSKLICPPVIQVIWLFRIFARVSAIALLGCSFILHVLMNYSQDEMTSCRETTRFSIVLLTCFMFSSSQYRVVGKRISWSFRLVSSQNIVRMGECLCARRQDWSGHQLQQKAGRVQSYTQQKLFAGEPLFEQRGWQLNIITTYTFWMYCQLQFCKSLPFSIMKIILLFETCLFVTKLQTSGRVAFQDLLNKLQMKICRHHFYAGAVGFQLDGDPFHGKSSDSGNSNVLILSIILFFTSLIVGALIMMWYFYSKRNEQLEEPTHSSPPAHLQSLYQPPPFYSMQTKVATAPQEMLQQNVTPSVQLMNQGIQTSGSLNPMPAKSHHEVQTERTAITMSRAIQTSGDINNIRKTQASKIASDRPPTPVSAFQILRSSEDIKTSETVIPPVRPLVQANPNQIASRFRSEGPDIPLAVSRVLANSKNLTQGKKSSALTQNTPPFIPPPPPQTQPPAFALVDSGRYGALPVEMSGGHADIPSQVLQRQQLQTTQTMTPTPLGVSQPLIIPVLGPPLPPLPPMMNPALPPLPPLPPAQATSPPSGLRKTPPQGLQYPTLPSLPKSFPMAPRANPPMGWPYRGY